MASNTCSKHRDEHIQQVGKHRHIWERGSKPPGFWNSDFWTAAEVTEAREQGRKRELELVREVSDEATKGKGRWKKRDTNKSRQDI